MPVLASVLGSIWPTSASSNTGIFFPHWAKFEYGRLLAKAMELIVQYSLATKQTSLSRVHSPLKELSLGRYSSLLENPYSLSQLGGL